MVKFVNILAGLGAATVNPDGSIESSTASSPQQEGAAAAAGNMCPIKQSAIDQEWQKFHSTQVCNKAAFNDFKRKLNRHRTYLSLKASGAASRVPTAKTVTCPAVVHDLVAPNQAVGYDTSWIVENTASSAVILSFIKEGVEYSAVDSAISPPENDPNSILQPGGWKVVHTFEGHVFHARELLPDGSPGKVLLQHRVGLIPVGETTMRNLVCPDIDLVPMITHDDGSQEIDPDFARTRPQEWKDCNQLEIGFRNMAGCPLHGYYLRPDTCDELFKFHLGVESQVPDFMWDWKGESKFESTFMGHTFVFRSAFSDQVVDTITLKPTQIVDCPDLQQTVATALSTQAIILPSGEQLRNNGNVSNNTTTTTAAASSTRPQFGSGSLFYASPGGSF